MTGDPADVSHSAPGTASVHAAMSETEAAGRARALGTRALARWRRWLPNAVTFLRAALVPVILLLLARGGDSEAAAWAAFAIFVFAALTDTIDGWVARRFGGTTAFGAFADPLADKLLIVGTLVVLAAFDRVSWWIVIVVTAREIAVTLLRVVAVRRKGVVVSASTWGKVKTVAQIIAVGAVLLPIVDGVLVLVLLGAAVLLTVGSGLDYLVKVGALLRRDQEHA
jgi:CDP-diacylglycerol--glycerol-3-phosphate 3-phosphatidyltransferase